MNNIFSLSTEMPTMVKIKRIENEAEGFKTFYFDYKKKCDPGQFLMIWLPRINEKPFTVSFISKNEIGITVQQRGDFTKKLFELNAGNMIGVRGPYGNGFVIKREESCVITGGAGTATILPLIGELDKPEVIIGAKTYNQLLYRSKLPNANFATDDGTYGKYGYVTDVFSEVIRDKKISHVYTCGPEKMMIKIINICLENGIDCQFALERYMKCGIGVCGQCTCGKKRVCVDGPVFNLKDLPQLTELGHIYRNRSGKIVYLDN